MYCLGIYILDRCSARSWTWSLVASTVPTSSLFFPILRRSDEKRTLNILSSGCSEKPGFLSKHFGNPGLQRRNGGFWIVFSQIQVIFNHQVTHVTHMSHFFERPMSHFFKSRKKLCVTSVTLCDYCDIISNWCWAFLLAVGRRWARFAGVSDGEKNIPGLKW
jgi:hypothetical protein